MSKENADSAEVSGKLLSYQKDSLGVFVAIVEREDGSQVMIRGTESSRTHLPRESDKIIPKVLSDDLKRELNESRPLPTQGPFTSGLSWEKIARYFILSWVYETSRVPEVTPLLPSRVWEALHRGLLDTWVTLDVGLETAWLEEFSQAWWSLKETLESSTPA